MQKPNQNEKKLKQTLRALEKSLESQTKNVELIFQRGYVLYLLRKLESAEAAFSQALKIKPDFAQAYNARSIVNYDLCNFSDAISDCKHALNVNPRYKEALYNLARSQQKLHQF